MTRRQRVIMTYGAIVSTAAKRHVELNPAFYDRINDLPQHLPARLLEEAMGSSTSPYALDLDAMSGQQVANVMRAALRQFEESYGIRRNYFASAV